MLLRAESGRLICGAVRNICLELKVKVGEHVHGIGIGARPPEMLSSGLLDAAVEISAQLHNRAGHRFLRVPRDRKRERKPIPEQSIHVLAPFLRASLLVE